MFASPFSELAKGAGTPAGLNGSAWGEPTWGTMPCKKNEGWHPAANLRHLAGMCDFADPVTYTHSYVSVRDLFRIAHDCCSTGQVWWVDRGGGTVIPFVINEVIWPHAPGAQHKVAHVGDARVSLVLRVVLTECRVQFFHTLRAPSGHVVFQAYSERRVGLLGPAQARARRHHGS